jgi:hypothetical protein
MSVWRGWYFQLRAHCSGVARSILGRPALLFALIFPLAFFALYFHLLFGINGYLYWGNFVIPPNSLQLRPGPFLWNPYAFGGSLNPLPFTNLLNLPVDWPLYLSARGLGPEITGKIYVLATSLLLVLCFYVFTGQLVSSKTARIVSTAFFAFNPFELVLYSYGDYLFFVYQCFLILSLACLLRGVRRESLHWNYIVLGMALLTLSIPFFQAYYLGVFLFAITGVYFILRESVNRRRSALRPILSFLISLALLVPLAAPLLVSFLPSYSSLSPQSTFAPPVTTFSTWSVSPADLLVLKGYPPNLGWISASAGWAAPVFPLWAALFGLLIGVILASYLLTSRQRFLYYPVVACLAALVGSNLASPIASLNLGLYTHIPGYQVLAQSYYWDWIVLVFLYSQCLAELLDTVSREGIHLLGRVKLHRGLAWVKTQLSRVTVCAKSGLGTASSVTQSPAFSRGSTTSRMPPNTRLERRSVLVVLVLLVLFTSALPIASQGYYTTNDSGIHGNSLPAEYSTLPTVLAGLIGNTASGVAFLPPDGWTFFNASQGLPNPLVVYPTYRVAETPSYRTPITPSTSYILWAYQQFYENTTTYFPELMTLAGYTFYVVLNGLNSGDFPYFSQYYGENATMLMGYQQGERLVYSTPAYGIYESTYGTPNVVGVKGLTLVLGGYDLLNEAAYAGVNLTRLALVFGSDITSKSWASVLGNTSGVITDGMDGLTGLSIFSSTFFTVDASASASAQTSSNGWYSSDLLYDSGTEIATPGALYSYPFSFALSTGIASLGISVNGLATGSYDLFAEVMYSVATGGRLLISLNGDNLSTLSTNYSNSGTASGFRWVEIPVQLSPGANSLAFDSLIGTNALAEVALVPSGLSNDIVRNTQSQLEARSIPELSIYTPTPVGGPPYQANVSGVPIAIGSKSASGQLLFLAGPTPTQPGPSIDIPTPFAGGTLFLDVLNLSGGVFTESSGSRQVGFGYNSRSGILDRADDLEWLRAPIFVPVGQNQTRITLAYGYSYIAETIYISNYSDDWSEFSLSELSSSVFALSNVEGGVSNFTLNQTLTQTGLTLSGHLEYSQPEGPGLANLECNCTLREGTAIALNFNISPGAVVDVDGAVLVGNSSSSIYILPGQLFLGNENSTLLTLGFHLPSYYGQPGPTGNSTTVSYSIQILGLSKSYSVNLTSIEPSILGQGGVQYSDNGYAVTLPTAGIVVVRVPVFPSESASGTAVPTIIPLLGGIDTGLVFSSSRPSSVDLLVASATPVYLSLLVPVAVLAGTVLVTSYRSKQRRVARRVEAQTGEAAIRP